MILTARFPNLQGIQCTFAGPLRISEGWSGGAMVLGKLPVPGRPTI